MKEIKGFRGDYSFLSNMYPCKIEFENQIWNSSENIYQSFKSELPIWKNFCLECTPKESKIFAPKKKTNPNNTKFGNLTLDPNWDEIKPNYMKLALEAKFSISSLREILLKTNNKYIEETNTWHDYYWGVCNGIGKNVLGNMLMDLRKKFFSDMIAIHNKHTYKPSNNVQLYIGRGSCLGNPYTHKENTKAEFIVPTRDEAISNYKLYIQEQLKINKEIKDTMNFIWKTVVMDNRNIDLICYCKPQSCHGDVLKELILEKI